MSYKISVVFPCRNEKEAIGEVLKETIDVLKILREQNVEGEIIVSDSSNDGSDEIAKRFGVKVVKHNKEGYGIALQEGFKKADGDILIFLDADGTYNPKEIPQFIDHIKDVDIVIGSRLRGKIQKGAMPFLHRYIGTPFINLLLYLFFGIKVSDSQTGFRAIKKEALNKLNLQTTGMEFTTEMLIKAKKLHLKIKEIPISYSLRKGQSKLRRYRDGLRNFRYIFIQIPLSFFVMLSLFFTLLGWSALLLSVFNVNAFYFLNTATFKIIFPILGIEIFFLGIFAKTILLIYFEEPNSFVQKIHSWFTFKRTLWLSSFLILVPFILRILNLSEGIFEILFVLVMYGILILFNVSLLSFINTFKNERRSS